MVIATIAGFDVGLVHVAGGLAAAAVSVIGFGIGTGRMNIDDLLNLSPGKGPGDHIDDTKQAVMDAEPDPSANTEQRRIQTLKANIAREIDHGIRASYHTGKMDGMRSAGDEDKHYKATLLAVFGILALLAFELSVYFGVV